jgi:anti-sigma B factor antagonist
MNLTFHTHTQDPWTILAVEGELDLHTSPQLRAAILEIANAGSTRIALDLREVPFMDSSSLGVLVEALKRSRDKGGDIALVAPQRSPEKVLSLTGLDKVFLLVGDVDQLPSSPSGNGAS